MRYKRWCEYKLEKVRTTQVRERTTVWNNAISSNEYYMLNISAYSFGLPGEGSSSRFGEVAPKEKEAMGNLQRGETVAGVRRNRKSEVDVQGVLKIRPLRKWLGG
jgi:hypothetical protein